MLTVGISNELNRNVTKETTAATLGSGMLEVYATPAMVALMEETCMKSVQEELDAGCGTVGPVGMNVRCVSKLVEVDGRKLVFDVQAFDEAGLIGQGTHERFIIENEKFLKKAEQKLDA